MWGFSTYIIGVRLLPEDGTPADRKALMRVLGFASAPGILRALGFIPGLSIVILLTATGWMKKQFRLLPPIVSHIVVIDNPLGL